MIPFWRKYSPLIHIGVWIFFAGMAWANVAAQSARIDKLEIQTDGIEQIRQDVGVIKESLRWIEKNMGRK